MKRRGLAVLLAAVLAHPCLPGAETAKMDRPAERKKSV